MAESKESIRWLLQYDFKSGLKATESACQINNAFGARTVSNHTAQNWFNQFRNGDERVADHPQSGRPSDVEDDHLLVLIKADSHKKTHELADDLGVSHTTIINHLHQLGFVCKFDQWVPHKLTNFDKQCWVDAATSLLSYCRTTNWLSSIVTGDEEWCLYANIKCQRSWVEVGTSAKHQPKQALHQSKVMLYVWWDCNGIVYYELLDQGAMINAKCYCAQLDHLATELQQKCPRNSQVRFLHDNARPHTARMMQDKLLQLGWEVLIHPPYSPDLAPSDYALFHKLSHSMENLTFKNRDHLNTWLNEFFQSLPTDFYSKSINDLPNRWHKVVDSDGDYFD